MTATLTAPPPSASARGVYMTHADYYAEHPTDARYDEERDILALRRHVQETGSKDGFVPRYPCSGTLEWHDHDGPVWIAVCSECGFEIGVPAKTIDPAAEIERRKARAHFPSLFADKPFDPSPGSASARAMLRQWVERWKDEDRPPAPALVGPPGRGKTHLMVLVAGDLVRRHLVDAMYAPAGELIEAMRESFRDGIGTRSDTVDRATTCGLLVLDDMAKAPTDWCAERIYELIDARYRAGLPVLMGTNVPVMEWPEAFTPRTASRLAALTAPVAMDGPDWRQQGPAESSDIF